MGETTKRFAMEKTVRNTIKVRRAQRDNTVVVKVMYDINEVSWSAIVNWGQANIKDIHIFGTDLLEIVKQVKQLVKDGLIDLMGRVQEVDVILRMPLKDLKITVTFKEAMKAIDPI